MNVFGIVTRLVYCLPLSTVTSLFDRSFLFLSQTTIFIGRVAFSSISASLYRPLQSSPCRWGGDMKATGYFLSHTAALRVLRPRPTPRHSISPRLPHVSESLVNFRSSECSTWICAVARAFTYCALRLCTPPGAHDAPFPRKGRTFSIMLHRDIV
jgi:hypothetical protein